MSQSASHKVVFLPFLAGWGNPFLRGVIPSLPYVLNFNIQLSPPKKLFILSHSSILSILFSKICLLYSSLWQCSYCRAGREYGQQLHLPHSPDCRVPLHSPPLVTPLVLTRASPSPRDQQRTGMHQLTAQQADRVSLTTYKRSQNAEHTTEYLFCFDFSVAVSNLMSDSG